MKKSLKIISLFMFSFLLAFSLVACGGSQKKDDTISEKVELSKVVLNEVEFNNSEAVKLKQEGDEVEITGTIDAMSESQKTTYGVQDVTHVVALKVTFDKEKTLKLFEIKGNTTKVFSENSTDENYAGSLSELLDNESGEDAYTNLVLSANTKEYTLTAKYTDESVSEIEIEIKATLATGEAE